MSDYFLIERKDTDLPFYNGKPKKISFKAWIGILLFMIFGFIYLSSVYLPSLSQELNQWISVLVLPLSSIIGLLIFTKRSWREIFRKPKSSDILIIIVFVVLTFFVANIVSNIAEQYVKLEENPSAITQDTDNTIGLFFKMRGRDLFQLFGEEFLAILPFLALMQLFYRKCSRKFSLFLALLFSSIFFGLLHLPTYNWNLVQAMLLISTVRIFISLPYIITRNIWVSFLVHYIYDTIIFAIVFFM